MPSSPSSKSSRERVRAHRARLRAQGLRPVTYWLPDTSSPEFLEQARRDSIAVSNAPDAEEVLQFIAETMDWPPDDPDMPDYSDYLEPGK